MAKVSITHPMTMFEQVHSHQSRKIMKVGHTPRLERSASNIFPGASQSFLVRSASSAKISSQAEVKDWAQCFPTSDLPVSNGVFLESSHGQTRFQPDGFPDTISESALEIEKSTLELLPVEILGKLQCICI
jgi:hypothetical protein